MQAALLAPRDPLVPAWAVSSVTSATDQRYGEEGAATSWKENSAGAAAVTPPLRQPYRLGSQLYFTPPWVLATEASLAVWLHEKQLRHSSGWGKDPES